MKSSKIKCVVWDLDNTIWNGILMEDEKVSVNRNVIKVIKELDRRGILNSIASKNEISFAEKELKKIGLWEYFVYPQINWSAKSSSIQKIAEMLNVGIDSFAFVDDQKFELDEVHYNCPEVKLISAEAIDNMLDMEGLIPEYISIDACMRRKMYQVDILRKIDEEAYHGTKEEFLRTLNITLKVSMAKQDDLVRVEELVQRTNQMNTAGYAFSYEELEHFINHSNYRLFVVDMKDIYGAYGKIGVILLHIDEKVWTIKLLITSCRVISRGIGGVLMQYLAQLASNNGVNLFAEFKANDKNRIMYITYKMAGFVEKGDNGECMVLEYKGDNYPAIPDYIKLIVV